MVSIMNKISMGIVTFILISICVFVLLVLRVLRIIVRVRVNYGEIIYYCVVCMW